MFNPHFQYTYNLGKGGNHMLSLHNLFVGGDSDYFDRSVEISEIDARLNRLQDFMKTNLV